MIGITLYRYSTLNQRLPAVGSKLAGLHTSAKSGLRTHAPILCAWGEAATVIYLVVQLATPKRAILQLFLLFQGLSLKYVLAWPVPKYPNDCKCHP